MPAYLVQLPDQSGFTLQGGANTVSVFAEDAADARIMAERVSNVDAADWANATVTEVAEPSDLLGWRLRCQILDPSDGSVVQDFTYTGIASDALDDMGAGLAALFNVPYTAAYNATTQVITLATGAGADDLGDQEVRVGMFPPDSDSDSGDLRLLSETNGVASAIDSVTDQGLSTADLEVTLSSDAWVVPGVPVLLKS